MTWKRWDDFCRLHFGKAATLPNRPSDYDLDHLCTEVVGLIDAGAARLEGNFPFNFTHPKKKPEGADRPVRRGRVRRKLTDSFFT